jgi:hypothetical protein
VFLSALTAIKGVQYILVQGIPIPTLGRLHPLIGLLLRENSPVDQFCATLLDSAHFKRAQLTRRKALLCRQVTDRRSGVAMLRFYLRIGSLELLLNFRNAEVYALSELRLNGIPVDVRVILTYYRWLGAAKSFLRAVC